MVEPIEFKVNELTLRGKIYWATEPKNLSILFLHGWTGAPNEAAAQKMAENGFTSMTFSLSGHNDSDGKLEEVTRAGSLKEVVAAYDFFTSKLPEDAKIGAVGTSYGSYLAALLSAERPVAFLQMRVPANHPDEHFNDIHSSQTGHNPKVLEWRKQPQTPDATKSLRAVHSFSGPIQIIEAGADELVPHQTVQNYLNAVADKTKLDYRFMDGWPHSLGDDPERNRQYQELLINWLNQISKTAAA